ncbi:MAG: type IV pilus modification protein PilV [Gammaproteobacteria bacterium]|nr:type IV pilus modification protein PilV [Gammaproteobacteria bacterium]
MIAVLVLAIGLLGLSALQANGLRANGSAQQRSQAVALANDMMERLRADFRNAIAGAYNRDIGDELPDAGSIPSEEVINWVTTLQMLLPAADGAVVCDGIGNCTVTVQWDDSRAGGSDATSFSFSSQI